jgi:rhodanese-related sulfurtransferase
MTTWSRIVRLTRRCVLPGVILPGVVLPGVLLLVAPQARAITAEELAAALEDGASIRIIDIRPSAEYQISHIPGAVSVPAKLVPHKRMPPLGRVVVYDSGLNPASTREAVDALNAKSGIDAEALVGGLASWESRSFADTGGPGMTVHSVAVVTYEKLMELVASETDLVLIDLRVGEDLVDLSEAFPSAQVTGLNDRRRAEVQSGREQASAALGETDLDPDALYVLIDDGDLSRAETVGLRLDGSGIKRVAILGGGEESIRNQGATESVTTSHSKIVSGGGNE